MFRKTLAHKVIESYTRYTSTEFHGRTNQWNTCRVYKNCSIPATRVDVSETFSADQLWFRTISSLFQRCSLPENLWNSADSGLNSADFLWNSDEQRWFLNNSDWKFLVNFTLFIKIFLSTSISRHIILVFNPVYEKKWATKIFFSIFVQDKDITHTRIFGFTVTAQVTKQIWFNFSKTFLRL